MADANSRKYALFVKQTTENHILLENLYKQDFDYTNCHIYFPQKLQLIDRNNYSSN